MHVLQLGVFVTLQIGGEEADRSALGTVCVEDVLVFKYCGVFSVWGD